LTFSAKNSNKNFCLPGGINMGELIESALHSTPQGLVGVGLIGVYFVIILASAAWRIRRGEHLARHH
jgi:hypothetical protein